MPLRGRVDDTIASYPDPELGVNLNDAQEDLKPGESPKMGNCIFRGGTSKRLGSGRLTATQVAASLQVRGGHKFYYGDGSKERLIAYGTRVAIISDAGGDTDLGAGNEFTSDKDMHFLTWPVTDKVYMVNDTEEMYEYDATTFQKLHFVADLSLVSATYRWLLSASGTSEYYLDLAAGGDPDLNISPLIDSTNGVAGGFTAIDENGTEMTKATVGSLTAGQYDYGDNDSLGFLVPYIRLTDSVDPDTKAAGFVKARLSAQVPGRGSNATPKMMAPILDRLMCITTNGIERTDPRVAHIWSKDSSWATIRPLKAGLFTAIKPFTLQTDDDLQPGIIAFQGNAHYLVSGTDFGDDVTATVASAGENSVIELIDGNVGTSSPYSVVEVGGVGLFWVTSDLNVYWLPQSGRNGRFVGDKIRSTTTVEGLEGTTLASVNQIWCEVFDRFLRVCFPRGSQTYGSTQYWLDLRRFKKNTEDPVWYGPMTGQTVGRAWAETQAGDNALFGGDGNSATGVFVYQLDKAATYADAVGTADNAINMSYQTFFPSFGEAGTRKYLRSIEVDANTFTGTATIDVDDLSSSIKSGLTLTAT